MGYSGHVTTGESSLLLAMPVVLASGDLLNTKPALDRGTRIGVAQRGAKSASMHSAVSYLTLPCLAYFVYTWRAEKPVVLSSVQD